MYLNFYRKDKKIIYFFKDYLYHIYLRINKRKKYRKMTCYVYHAVQ